MRLPDILKRHKVPRSSLYRWMEKHPNLSEASPDSLLGHSFPQPTKINNVNEWDKDEVERWFTDNAKTIGRHPVSFIMPYSAFLHFLATRKVEVITIEDKQGTEKRRFDDLDLVKSWERTDEDGTPDGDGMHVKIICKDAEDAVLFKLKHFYPHDEDHLYRTQNS